MPSRVKNHLPKGFAMHRLRRRRGGFSLVELLVVIAVIAVLTTFLTIAVMGMIGNAKEAATRSTIKLVAGLMDDRMESLRRSKLTNDAYLGQFANFQNACNNPTLAKVNARKAAYRLWIPQTWAEAQTLATAAGMSVTPPAPINPATESAEVLYWLFTEGPQPASQGIDADIFNSQNVKDTDSPPNGKLEIVDGWGNPISFWRWPARLLRPDGIGSTVQAENLGGSGAQNWASVRSLNPTLPVTEPANQTDPEDPQGTASNCNPGNYEDLFHLPGTFLFPLICSAGADGIMGIGSPGDKSTGAGGSFGYWARHTADPNCYTQMLDNITNLNTRSGGK
jgi:prepilin-type N-terminal cleavage/methylation domain-containing protein